MSIISKANRLINKSSKIKADNSKAFFNYGNSSLKANNIDKAIFFYNKALKSRPSFVQCWINLSQAYKSKGLISKSESSINRAIKIDPKISHPYFILGELFLRKGRLKKAVKALETAIKISPDFLEAYYALINAAIKLNDGKKTSAIINKCFKLDIDYTRVLSILLNAPNPTTSKSFNKTYKTILSNFMKRYDEIIYRTEMKISGDMRALDKNKLLNLKSERKEKIVNIGISYRNIGEEKKMRAAFLKFLKIAPKNKAYDVQYFRAYCAVGKYADAFKAAEKIMHSNTITIDELSDPFVGAMSADFIKKQLDLVSRAKVPKRLKIWKTFYKATLNRRINCEELKKISELIVGKYVWMKYPLAIDLRNNRNFVKSIKFLTEAKKVRPKDWLLNCAIAEALLCNGQKQEAFKQFEKIYSDKFMRNANVKAWKGECHIFTGQYAKAITDLDSAIVRENPIAYTWRGAAHFKSGMCRQALKDLNRAVRHRPNDLEARVWRGEVYRILKKFKRALLDLNFVIKQNRGYLWAYFNRALIKNTLKDYSGMKQDFDEINNHELIDIIKKRLNLKLSGKITRKQIVEILIKGLEFAKGNRRDDNYLLTIAFPEYNLKLKTPAA